MRLIPILILNTSYYPFYFVLVLVLTNLLMCPNLTNQFALILLCVIFTFLLAPVNRLDCYTMCYSKLLNVHNQTSLNEQLSIDGLTDQCCYIEPNAIKEIHNKDSDLGVIQINIRGSLNKQTEIKQLLSSNNVALPIEVILLCETWLKPTTLDLFKYSPL